MGARAPATGLIGYGTSLSFDLDGDGGFDESPKLRDDGYYWAFTRPTTIAVKAVDIATGASAVDTLEVQPAVGSAPTHPTQTLNAQG